MNSQIEGEWGSNSRTDPFAPPRVYLIPADASERHLPKPYDPPLLFGLDVGILRSKKRNTSGGPAGPN